MIVRVVEVDARPEWSAPLDQLTRDLEMRGFRVIRSGVESWVDSADAASRLLVAGHDEAYRPLLARLADATPTDLSRVVLVGCDLPWEPVTRDQPANALPCLLEEYKLAGAFRSWALVRWQEAPSGFMGPDALMDSLHSNVVQGYSSANYGAWFWARGKTMGEFLAAYLPVLDTYLRTGDLPA